MGKGRPRKAGRKSRKRSLAAKRGWDKRTRKAGTRQVFSAVVGRSHPVISTAKPAKDIGLGMAKIAYPRQYRRSRTAKLLDKL